MTLEPTSAFLGLCVGVFTMALLDGLQTYVPPLVAHFVAWAERKADEAERGGP